ncbi:MAG: carboxypeptidase-like regulatory domain-containing protein [Litorilinea sp.]
MNAQKYSSPVIRRARHPLWWRIGLICACLTAGLLYANTLHSTSAHANAVIPAAPGGISGRVTDADGVPLAEVDIRLWTAGMSVGGFASTDASGEYALGALPPGEYVVEFAPPDTDYAFQFYPNAGMYPDAEVLRIEETTLTDIDAVLQPSGAVRGRVLITGEGALREYERQVTLQRMHADGEWYGLPFANQVVGVNDPRGFVFDGFATGEYLLCVLPTLSDPYPFGQPGGCGPRLQITAGETLDYDVEFRLDSNPPARILGRITDKAGQPLPDITVRAEMIFPQSPGQIRERRTNFDGQYVFYADNLPPLSLYPQQHWLVYAVDPRLGNRVTYFNQVDTRENAQPVIITNNTPQTDIDFQLGGGQINGTISIIPDGDFGSARLVLYAYDAIQDEWQETHNFPISETGPYSLTVSPGFYRVHLIAYYGAQVAHNSYYGGATLEDATTIEIRDAQTTPDIDFVVGAGEFEGQIAGQVFGDAMPLAEMKVELLRGTISPHISTMLPSIATLTDAQGHYVFRGLQAGNYTLLATDPDGQWAANFYGDVGDEGFYPDSPLQLERRERQEAIDIYLETGGSIRGTVTMQDGAPANQAGIYLYLPEQESWNGWGIFLRRTATRTDETGSYHIEGLPPGEYRVAATPPALPYPQKFYTGNGPVLPAVYDTPGEGESVIVTPGASTDNINIRLRPFHAHPRLYLPRLDVTQAD